MPVIESPPGAETVIDGRPFLYFGGKVSTNFLVRSSQFFKSLLKENINYTSVADLTYAKTTAGKPDDRICQFKPALHDVAFVPG